MATMLEVMDAHALGEELLAAAELGILTQARWAVEAGADIEARNDIDCTPLLLAAINNAKREVSDYLVERGANLLAMSENGVTVMMGFAMSGWCDLIEKALDAGAEINAQDSMRDTALSLASAENHCAAVALLIRRGASPFRETSESEIEMSFFTEDTLIAALDAGLSTQATDTNGATLLMHASSGDTWRLCSVLVERGANVNATDIRGWTPLLHAALERAPKSFALLLESGASTSFVTGDGETFDDLLPRFSEEVRAAYHSWKARNVVRDTLQKRVTSGR